MALVVVLWQWADSQVAVEQPGRPTHSHHSHAARMPGLLIDINTADSRELRLLPGVGPVLAQRIVRDRAARGEFRSVAELDRVHGIGEKTIERVSGICTVTHAGRIQTMIAAKRPPH